MTPRTKPQTIDAYLAAVPPAHRAALEKLRKMIRTAAPKAVECIAWQLPCFRLDGKLLVAFGAAKHHCSFYPMSAATIAAHQPDLQAYETTKGTIHFQPDDPLPAALVRKLVKARIAENAARTAKSRR